MLLTLKQIILEKQTSNECLLLLNFIIQFYFIFIFKQHAVGPCHCKGGSSNWKEQKHLRSKCNFNSRFYYFSSKLQIIFRSAEERKLFTKGSVKANQCLLDSSVYHRGQSAFITRVKY